MKLARWREVLGKFFGGRGVFPHEMAFLLELPGRSLVQSPHILSNRLRLSSDSRVLEIGPGPGFFSAEVARHLPAGHLVLVDIQYEMLAKARARLRRANLQNISFVQGSAVRLPFKSDTFDVAFLVAVLGEVSDPHACTMSVQRLLRPGGILSVTESPGDPDALPQEEVRALAEASGLRNLETFPAEKRFKGLTLNFTK